MPGSHDRAAERVWGVLPAGTEDMLKRGLPPTDLQTVLIAAAKARAEQVTPAGVMRRWQQDRFVQPAASDSRHLAPVEARLWQLLPAEFTGIDLSPVTPLGTCASVGPVSQNRVVATVRSTEVVSDSTNTLAIEAAARRGLSGCLRGRRGQRQCRRASPPGRRQDRARFQMRHGPSQGAWHARTRRGTRDAALGAPVGRIRPELDADLRCVGLSESGCQNPLCVSPLRFCLGDRSIPHS